MSADEPTTHAADIVGYMYKAELYCPRDISDALDTGPGGAFDGWANVQGGSLIAAEDDLDEIAYAFGIDREDEHTFDSDYFPKRVLRRQLDGDEVCGKCSTELKEES